MNIGPGRSISFEELPNKDLAPENSSGTLSVPAKKIKKTRKPKKARRKRCLYAETETETSESDVAISLIDETDSDLSESLSDDETSSGMKQDVTLPISCTSTSTEICIDDIVYIQSGQYQGYYAKVLGKTPCADGELKINYLEKVCEAGTRYTSNYYFKVRRFGVDSRVSSDMRKLSSDEYYVDEDRYYIYKN